MNEQEICQDDIKTQPLEDLALPAEQSEETKAGQSLPGFGGFSGGATVARQRF